MSFKFFCLFKKFALGTFIILAFWSCTSEGEENPSGDLAALDLYDQSYGSDPIQTMDVYLPAGRSMEKTPLLIYIHGGAWIDGSKEEFTSFREDLSKSFPGYAFISLNYSLFNANTGQDPFPAQQADVLKAITYISKKTAEWKISDTIVLSGASAGGHLALLHAYKNKRIGNIKAVIAFFPPTDLAKLYDSSLFTEIGLNALLGGSPQTNPDGYAINSPITYINPSSPPTIFFHGTTDNIVPLSQSELLEQALLEAQVTHEFVQVPNQGHGFTDQTYPILFNQAADFIEKVIE